MNAVNAFGVDNRFRARGQADIDPLVCFSLCLDLLEGLTTAEYDQATCPRDHRFLPARRRTGDRPVFG